MRRILFVVALIAGLVFLTPSAALACSCVVSTPQEQVQRAGTILDGSVVWSATNGLETTYSVKVDQVFKGRAAAREKLITNANEGSCGLGELATGKRYLFFVSGEHPGRMTVSLCGGTTAYDAALVAKVQAATGPPHGPVATPASRSTKVDDSRTRGTSVGTVVATAVVLGLVLGGLLWLRRASSRRPF
ncbi:MAG: hypothetical protein ACJ72D_28380 [Marmoricola sp.]